MSDAPTQLKFDCRACGRQFAWKPAIAGKSAKCSCGAMVKVPAKPPKALEPEDPGISYDVETAPAAPANRCRACGQPLERGAVLCVHCGFNQKTGKKISTAIGDDDPAPAPPPKHAIPAAPAEPDLSNRFGGVVPGLRTPVIREEESPYRAMIKPAILMVVLLLLAGGAIFGFRAMSGGDAEANLHPVDRDVKDMMGSNGSTELKAWLADNERQQRMVMGMNERQGAAFADKLYKMGAVKVLAFGHLLTRSI